MPYTKRRVIHGSISGDYVTYCREDVAATAQLYRAAMVEYRRHPIGLQATKAFSPASIGKAYLRAMGISPLLERETDVPPDILGKGMVAFFGGRAECRIRKAPEPVVYGDYLSMYPTVNALMNTWELVIARRVVVENATEQVRRLLDEEDLFSRGFDRSFWPQLRCLVEIEPNDAILPVRAAYDHAGVDYGIGVNPYRLSDSTWYTLADVVAAVILGDHKPVVRQALRLRAIGREKGLRPVSIRGMVEVDPRDGDFFCRVIELRKRVEVDPRDGDFFCRVIELRKRVEADPAYSPEEAARLSAFLKVLANASSYGILAEFVRHEQADLVPVAVHAGREKEFTTSTGAPEDPGVYCFPPIAAMITGAARLMLALLERSVNDLGGHYVFCDTDSMGIVASRDGGNYSESHVRALSFGQVDRIVERFAALNPYDKSVVPGSILKIEAENFDAEGRRRQLSAWAISSKRYVLYTTGAVENVVDEHEEPPTSEGPELAKVSEHGLGHLLNPADPENSSEHWIKEAWSYLLRRALRLVAPEPAWLDRPALTRVTASGPTVLRWFGGYNKDRTYDEQVKPANFLLLAHPDPLDPSGALPIAPYEPNASKWKEWSWIDRWSGQPVKVTTEPLDGTYRPDTVRVRTYRDVLVAYIAHPEAKSLGPDNKPVTSLTAGLLRRRPVEAISPVIYVGKEGNKLDERISGLALSPEDYRTEYVDPANDAWSDLVVPVLRTMRRTELSTCAQLHRRSIERLLSGRARPHWSHERSLTNLAIQHARKVLTDRGEPVPGDDRAVLHVYLKTRRLQHEAE